LKHEIIRPANIFPEVTYLKLPLLARKKMLEIPSKRDYVVFIANFLGSIDICTSKNDGTLSRVVTILIHVIEHFLFENMNLKLRKLPFSPLIVIRA